MANTNKNKDEFWPENGRIMRRTKPDGSVIEFDENGVLKSFKDAHGLEETFSWIGSVKTQTLPELIDGEVRTFWSTGKLKYRKLPDGTIKEYNRDGNLVYQDCPTLGIKEEYHGRDILEHDRMTPLMWKKFPCGTEVTYHYYGDILKIVRPDGTVEERPGRSFAELLGAKTTE